MRATRATLSLRRRLLLSVFFLASTLRGGILATTPQAGRGDRPVAVSPGSWDRATPADACTGFHWGDSESPIVYELAIYRITEENDGGLSFARTLTVTVPGNARSWLLPLDHCLSPGVDYGWTLRGLDDSGLGGEWAEPLVFSVGTGLESSAASIVFEPDRPLPEAAAAAEGAPAVKISTMSTAKDEVVAALSGVRSPEAAISGPPVFTGEGTVAALRVTGEARTVDASSGQPKLWGQGRPGTKFYGKNDGTFCSNGQIKFGLSATMVEWASADAACPAGSWVCRVADVEPAPACAAARPSNLARPVNCSNPSADFGVFGLLADDATGIILADAATAMDLDDRILQVAGCFRAPVWCCFQ